MKKFLSVLIIVICFLIIGGEGLAKGNTQFDEDGNFIRADEMQKEWCKYNKGRDIIKNQCNF